MPNPNIPSDLPPPMNHVFVDFENVHHVDLSVIGTKAVTFTLLVGAKQTKLDAALVEKLMEHAASVQLIRLASSGRNALDFALAYYLGRAVLAYPTAHFHVVSKDGGYDPLIEHLRGRHINVSRHADFSTLIFSDSLKVSPVMTSAQVPKSVSVATPKAVVTGLEEQVAQVREHLRKPSTTRPRNRAKLISYLVAHLGHKLSEADAQKLVEKLADSGQLGIDGKGKVTYRMEAGGKL